MGRCDTVKETIENLLCVKQMHFPEEPLDWDRLLDKFAQSSYFSFVDTFLRHVLRGSSLQNLA